MTFTALHRALGVPPGPLTSELLDRAIDEHVVETDDLDWKSELPPAKGSAKTDFPKDVAAMANSGGGTIVYGIRESAKAATERAPVDELTEVHERALRSAAVTAISPPIFNLGIHRLGGPSDRAVVVVVPASVDGPHLIYRDDLFGAPRRNDADTVWMREREVEAMYRARFDERRHSTELMDSLYQEASDGRAINERAWLIAVAHPRIPQLRTQLTRVQAEEVLKDATGAARKLSRKEAPHPFDQIDPVNPRPGLRRWVFRDREVYGSKWRESWISIHHDGSVTLACAVGGFPISSERFLEGFEVMSAAVEAAVADCLAVVRAAATAIQTSEYEVKVGIEWSGYEPIQILTVDNLGYAFRSNSTPVHRYVPVLATIDARASDTAFGRATYDLARDCVNQGGITNLHVMKEPVDDV